VVVAQTSPHFTFIDKGVMVRDTRLAEEVARFTMERKHSTTTHDLTLNQALKPFYHGVASGDPLSDRVILWTRVTPERDSTITVQWAIASDTAMRTVVRSGTVSTNAGRDYTVKVDVQGLEPDRTYYYRFSALGRTSITGRTKTLPADTASNRHVRVVIVSCSSYPHGYFNAYGRIADRNDVDVVLHLGDYIYEYNTSETAYGGETGKRISRVSFPTNEIVSLADYRSRYSQYRLDPDLMRFHQQHPIVHVWDDHESANDSFTEGAENHTAATEGAWAIRKAVSKRVVYEWMPTRENADTLIRRRFQVGNLVDVFMLDTRLESRDEPIAPLGPDSTKARREAAINDPNRIMIGKAQFDWLTSGLRSSKAAWKLLGNQVMFTPIMVDGLDGGFMSRYSLWLAPFASTLSSNLEEAFYGDVWANYPAERNRVINFLQQNNIKNVVIGTGDFHTSFALDVTAEARNSSKYDRTTGRGAVAVEFMCPSISSANFDENFFSGFRNFFYNQLRNFVPPQVAFLHGIGIAQTAVPTTLTAFRDLLNERNPHLKFQNLTEHGYTLLDFTPERVQGDYWFVDTILARSSKERFAGGLFTRSGESNLQKASVPAPQKQQQALPAPAFPQSSSLALGIVPNFLQAKSAVTILSTYPNPASEAAYLQYEVSRPTPVTVRLLDVRGNVVSTLVEEQMQEGIITLVVELTKLQGVSGLYRFVVSTPEQAFMRDITIVR
jgi:alkaline phosphatase D